MLSQMLINSIQKRSESEWIDKLKYHGAHLIRQLVLRFHDPAIRYEIGQFELRLPLSSNLPFIVHKHPYYATNIARIAGRVRKKYQQLTLIDVGAFVGDSVAFLRRKSQFPVLCIEGNQRFFCQLEKNMSRFADVDCVNAYLNIRDPRGKSPERNLPGKNVSLVDILRQYPRYSQSKMLKVDTDGYDGLILRGASEYLSRVKPILFFEYDPDLLGRHGEDGDSLWAMLRLSGYKMALFYENIGTYILSADLENTRLLEELHQWLSGYGGHRYFDVCLFPGCDLDLGESIRLEEMAFFKGKHFR
jgi:hypothetical protein